MLKPPTCPRCRAPLKLRSRWFGLVRRYPGTCSQCGAHLLYDKAGGIYVREETVRPGGSGNSPSRGR